MAIDYAAEIKHQEESLKAVVEEINAKLTLKVKIEGALEMLTILKQQVEDEAKKVVEEVKAVEAEVVEEVKKVL